MSAERLPRAGLALVLVATLVTLFLGFAHTSLCVRTDFDQRVQRDSCYTDIVPLYRAEGLADRKMPYLEARNEYPVVTAMFMWLASLPARGEGEFFLINAVGLALLGLAAAWLLFRMAGWRAPLFALAPSLALYAFLNWDLLAVALTTAGLAAYFRRRDGTAGSLLGLAVAAKVYPVLVLVPLCLDRVRTGDRRGAARLALAAVVTWLVVDVPFAVLAPDRWSFFFRFSSARAPTPGTLWYVTCALVGHTGCLSIGLINVVSLIAFLVGVLVVARATFRRPVPPPAWTLAFPMVVLFLLTSKVYSPQYALWLLPFFVLVMPDFRLFALFEIADAAVFLTEFSWIGHQYRGTSISAWPLAIAVTLRAAVLLAILVTYVRRGPTEPSAQLLANTSPSGSSYTRRQPGSARI
ncbi:MAG: glycosyltransferase 87 family protein [Actinomycetota bacterium]